MISGIGGRSPEKQDVATARTATDQSMGSVPATRPTAAGITLDEFQDALGRYEQLIEAVSASKTS